MAKDFIINTSGLNSYGTRVLTPGIDLTQYKRNPVLLYMHTRGFDGKSTPIGRVENIRVEGDELRGTPVFDMKDPFAAEIARKWDEPSGKILRLASGADSEIVPLLKNAHSPAAEPAPEENNGNNQTLFSMNKILLTLGLPATATEDDAVNAITKLQGDVARIETLELSRIEAAVDAAIEARKTTADKRDHLITLGKKAGFDVLQSTIAMLTPVQKPTQLINPAGGAASSASVELAYSEMSDEQLRKLEKENPEKFMQLFKAEFGYVPKIDK